MVQSLNLELFGGRIKDSPQDFQVVNKLAQGELDPRVKHYIDENRRLKQELQQFAFAASHDLNEPLDKITSFSKLLMEECDQQLDEDARKYVSFIREGAERMQLLISGLLKLSRVGSREEVCEEVDLNRVAQRVLDRHGEQILLTKAEIHISKLPQVQGDPVLLEQLLDQLLDNALKFHLTDQVPIIRLEGKIRTKELMVDGIDTHPVARNLCELVFKDQGIGFENDYIDRIFQPFQRLHPRGKYAGAGLGLAICKKIITRHGGVISAKGKPGAGATFKLWLPCTPADRLIP